MQFFVVHVTGRPSNQQDVVDVYLNPPLNATPGLTPTFSAFSSGSGCTGCPAALSRTMRLRVRQQGNFAPPYTATFDEIRVGRTFADVAPLAPCGKADVGTQGALPGFDGLLDNNDFIVFIDSFFAGSDAADIGQQGGEAGTDGLLDNNDFVVYINQFFQAC